MPTIKQVTAAEADYVTQLFALAFFDDPTWGWAFPDAQKRMEQHRLWWSLFMHSALPYGRVWMTDDGSAASLWIPPNRPELSDEDAARMEPMLREFVGAHADEVLVLLDRFDANHPRGVAHYYLSLLGTNPDHRGNGKGRAWGCWPQTWLRSTRKASRRTWSRATETTITDTSGLGSCRLASSRHPPAGRLWLACGAIPDDRTTSTGLPLGADRGGSARRSLTRREQLRFLGLKLSLGQCAAITKVGELR